ncbi:hypothetical protein MVES1_001424 [Malassezia vespertilionis]|uniref:Spt23p n=1 Tax=Malassezia vespertilionis TaxID=2020962 RepID=A0A2N1JES0_9BASI|nr:uncharacterized protein MVES1_001424 [Malassezia vespertilionis]PKI85025.1 Spt23p [Malassezia vespertilionis]WFD06084.1 hypothetical protein MVES1_001424 [Malassezia vespertilionis]
MAPFSEADSTKRESSQGDYQNLFAENTPTPPSLTSESSPASSHDQEEPAPEHVHVPFGVTPFGSRQPSVAPSEGDFLSDWRPLTSSPSLNDVQYTTDMPLHDGGSCISDESRLSIDKRGMFAPLEASPGQKSTQHPWLTGTAPPLVSAGGHVQSNALPMYRFEQSRQAQLLFGMPPAAFENGSMPSTSANGLLSPSTDASSIAPRLLNEQPALQPLHERSDSISDAPHSMSSDADLLLSSTSIIRPHCRDLPSNMQILVHGIPAKGAKSRVETQIRMRIELVTNIAGSDAPVWERIGSFDHIKVPPLSGTKRKSKKHQKTNVPHDSLLMLEADVINATAPHSRVYVCNSCRERERKRAHRKKSKRLSPSTYPTEEEIRALNIDPSLPNAVDIAMQRMEEEERKHTVLFNCGDYIDFHNGEVTLSTRITCYCRHHREKLGFQIVFTLRDRLGTFVASGTTPPIMIMDDHKSIAQNTVAARMSDRRTRRIETEPEDGAFASSLSPKSVEPASGRPRERPKPYEDAPARQRFFSAQSTHDKKRGASFLLDSTPNYLWNTLPDAMQSEMGGQNALGSLRSVSPAMDEDALNLLNTPFHVDAPDCANMVPMETSFASPLNNVPLPLHDPLAQLPQSLAVPKITKLIPAEGPTTGGIEITILGENFADEFECYFGDMPCSFTRIWAESTLVCLLPPSAVPGPVTVTLRKGQVSTENVPGQPLQLFTYVDPTERALMELALQVVGMQMTGRMASAKDVAMRIVNSNQQDGTMFSARAGQSVEENVMALLQLLNTGAGRYNGRRNVLHANNKEGHTLLHLAIAQKYHDLTAYLLAHGALVNAQDTNGCTPLHFAAMYSTRAIVEMLLAHGATATMQSNQHYLALDMAHGSDKSDTCAILAQWMQDMTDEPGYSDATDSEDEDGTPIATNTPLLDELDESDSEDASISFAELAALCCPAVQGKDKHALNTPTRPNSPAEASSPPPTYDEATLDNKSGSSRHVLGEKLVTDADQDAALRGSLLTSAEENSNTRRASAKTASGSRSRKRAARMRSAKDMEGENQVVPARRGVYDDRMLLWFWIPAMIAVFLVTMVLNGGGYFLHHDIPPMPQQRLPVQDL